MAKKEVMQGNEALAESALRAGCRFFAGYPITPQTEITEYLAAKMNDMPDRAFVQGESELASINMVYGASGSGARAMTATAGQGLALMAEGMSQLADAQVPAVIVDVQRGGPGNGGTAPSQGDYNFVTKSLGHGGFHAFVFGPSTVQETADMVYEAFDIADEYRCVVMIMTDGMLGHLIESVELKPYRDLKALPPRPWTEKGNPEGRKLQICGGQPDIELEKARRIEKIYEKWERELARVEHFMTDDAEVILAAWGTVARTAKTAIRKLRAEGHKIGLIRPMTLHPFPKASFTKLDEKKVRHILVLEDSIPAQFYDDVMAALGGKPIPTTLYARSMGLQVSAEEAEEQLRKLL